MLIKIQNFNQISCDCLGLPRFWSFAWSNTKLANLTKSTRTRRLNDVDKLYNYVDETYQHGALDDAIARVDIEMLANIFFGYFHHLQLQASSRGDPSSQAFKHAFDFVIETCKLIKPTVDFKKVDQKLRSLENVYGSLRFNRKIGVVQIRVLPTDVLETCIHTINPDSANFMNPFKGEKTRWKNFLVFMLLLETGMRSAEALLLPANSPYHQGVDRFTGEHTIWMNIETLPNDEEENSDAGDISVNKYRSGRDMPALKNAYATRQITISRELAFYIDYYLESVRPTNASHQYLICNNKDGSPLSLRGLRKIFETLTGALPKEVLDILEARTQGSRSVSAHDLRHTCATVCMHEWNKDNDSTEVLARMRRKFGWSADSTMPSRYAALAYDQRISMWVNQRQNLRVEAIRSMTELEGTFPT